MLKKLTIISILLFSVLSVSYSQNNIDNQKKVRINQVVSQNSTTLTFENQRNINKDKIDVFVNRLVNYYDELESIDYNSTNNHFTLRFNITEIKKENLDDVLSHFNVYSYLLK